MKFQIMYAKRRSLKYINRLSIAAIMSHSHGPFNDNNNKVMTVNFRVGVAELHGAYVKCLKSTNNILKSSNFHIHHNIMT